jgi:peroxiredoxin
MKRLFTTAKLGRFLLGAVCLLSGSFGSCYMPTNTGPGGTGPREVSRLPDFSLTTLSGERANSQDYDQKVLVVNFWATWCAPCVVEIPHLNDLYSDFQSRGVEILGISMDTVDPEIVRRFTERHGVKYLVVLGDSSVGEDFGGVRAIPTTFVVDRQGKIVKKYEGFRPEFMKDTRRTIEQILG